MRELLVVVLSCVSLSGCLIAPPAPDDLTFVSLSVADTAFLPMDEQKDIARFNWNRMPRKVLQVEFASKFDIRDFSKNWNNPYIWSRTCREWDIPRLVQDATGGSVPAGPLEKVTSSVYWNNIEVLPLLKTHSEPQIEYGSGPFIYHFYIDISRKGGRRPDAGYDLLAQQEDVCFQVGSAEFMRPGARTNVVTIPKEALAVALKR